MADGLFYVDSRAPWTITDPAAVTVIATNLALIPPANLPVLGPSYWWAGKAVRIRLFGRMSTAATPGTQTFSLWWGTGGAANGTSVCASAAVTMIASQTNLSWELEFLVRCRVIGGSGVGSLLGTGRFIANAAAVAVPALIPASAPAAVTVDLTQAFVLSPQVLAVTSVTNTMQVHDINFEALN
jgi:hypothetical protein